LISDYIDQTYLRKDRERERKSEMMTVLLGKRKLQKQTDRREKKVAFCEGEK